MTERMLVATRKGLLQLARKNGGWNVARVSFPGIAVTATLHDARDEHALRRAQARPFRLQAASLGR